MRLIDADALEDMDFETCDTDDWYPIKERVRGKNRIRQIVKDAPTVDAVPVVRCKDCRWGRESCGNIECFVDINIPTEYHGHDWFCPNGERR